MPFGINVSELDLPWWLLFSTLHFYAEHKFTDLVKAQGPSIASAVLIVSITLTCWQQTCLK